EWTDSQNETNVYHFEHNSYSDVPDKDYRKIRDILFDSFGLVYVYDMSLRTNEVLNERPEYLVERIKND
ncbi:MAG: hypothetical protein NUV65_03535, partial [Candidatus Roizmanbacteria bacterium]|nr:hypothetical protein [Candidatus Roizmanbacteria bacterium]